MESHTIDQYPPSYTVATPIFEGPLDLLLQLIKRAELDITNLALAQVTDQFLLHIKDIQEVAFDEVSSFLVIASKLMQIKSEALLPRPPEIEPGEEDVSDDLVRQLIIYKRYKEIAEFLNERESLGLRTYLRMAPPPKVDGKLDLSGVNIDDLINAAVQVFSRIKESSPIGPKVTPYRVSIVEKIKHITATLREKRASSFKSLLGKTSTKVEIVVTFLAMLELVKRYLIIADQEVLFGEIKLKPTEGWDDLPDIESEFSEADYDL
ncbi:MAG: hypothetical protein FVQ83_01995 [Chloroflexi bacterium]|nr:hypothetical protein [Chloroflexota bacterium]